MAFMCCLQGFSAFYDENENVIKKGLLGEEE